MRDAFALRFDYERTTLRYHVGYGVGITVGGPPPAATPGGTDLQVWEFRGCAPAVLSQWLVDAAQATCTVGAGWLIQPTGAIRIWWGRR